MANQMWYLAVLLVYLHLVHHYKVNTDMECFRMTLPSVSTLERVCNYKQPVVFDTELERLPRAMLSHVRTLMIQDTVPVPMGLEDGLTLMKVGVYGSYGNVLPVAFLRYYQGMNAGLRPSFTTPEYDFIVGSDNYRTPWMRNRSYRAYFMVTEGSVTVKCSPYRKGDMEISVGVGQVVYVPPFWWYSLTLHDGALVCTVKYQTVLHRVVSFSRPQE